MPRGEGMAPPMDRRPGGDRDVYFSISARKNSDGDDDDSNPNSSNGGPRNGRAGFDPKGARGDSGDDDDDSESGGRGRGGGGNNRSNRFGGGDNGRGNRFGGGDNDKGNRFGSGNNAKFNRFGDGRGRTGGNGNDDDNNDEDDDEDEDGSGDQSDTGRSNGNRKSKNKSKSKSKNDSDSDGSNNNGNGNSNNNNRGGGGKKSGNDDDTDTSVSSPLATSTSLPSVDLAAVADTESLTRTTTSLAQPTDNITSSSALEESTATPDSAQGAAVISDPSTTALPTITPGPSTRDPTTTTTFIPLMTGVQVGAVESQPRKGIETESSLKFDFVSSTLLVGTSIVPTGTKPTSTGTGQNGASKGNINNGSEKKDDDRLDQTTEHVLIGAASIGSFILFCFAVWFVRHMMKKSKAKKGGGSSRSSSGSSSTGRGWPGLAFASRLTAKLPFLRGRRGGWENLDGPRAAAFPQAHYKSASVASSRWTNETDGGNNVYRQQSMSNPRGPPASLRLPSSQAAEPINVDPQVWNNAAIAGRTSPTRARQASPSFSSTDAFEFGGTLKTYASDGPRQPQRAATLQNQAGLPRQPSDAYTPSRRLLNRASELSSLSSGFGDGDFVIPDPVTEYPPPPAGGSIRQSANPLVGRFSWLSQGRRDTVYTQSSEDSPPRFRSVNSWVDQQSGRIKRARQREQEHADAPPVPVLPGHTGIPGIHNPPAEQSFNMMMQDDEVPRRVEDTMAMRS